VQPLRHRLVVVLMPAEKPEMRAPLFVVRRRAILGLAALTPLSIAVLQIAYLGFLPPTALLLLDTAVLAVAGQLGVEHQPRPSPAA
jgi:hypothetical protein